MPVVEQNQIYIWYGWKQIKIIVTGICEMTLTIVRLSSWVKRRQQRREIISDSFRVILPVCADTLAASKPFVADVTEVWLLSSVNSHVWVQTAALSEAFLAHVTTERLITGVNQHVSLDAASPTELLVAHVTSYICTFIMNLHVHQKIVFSSVMSVADTAAERLRSATLARYTLARNIHNERTKTLIK